MKRNLSKIGNYQYCIDPLPRIPQFMVYLLMTPMFSIFTLAIKFDCVFLTIFQNFYLLVLFLTN